MAIIRSGDDGTLLKVDAASKAARAVLYDASGNPIDVNHPLAVYLTAPVGGVVVADGGGSLTVDDGGGSLTVDGAVNVGNFPATQPVSGTVAVSNHPTIIDPTDRANRLLGHVTVDSIPEVEVKNDAGSPLAVSDAGGTLTVDDGGGSLTVDGSVSADVSDRASRLLGHVTVDNQPGTQPVSGTVAVSNLPATQPVSGTVSVGNLPATQHVADGGGSLSVDDGGGTLSVDGSLAVTNFPAVQPVSGTVAAAIVSNATDLVYDTHGLLPIEVVPTTLTDGTTYWAMRNGSTKRIFIQKFELTMGFVGTAAASRSAFRIERFAGATPAGGTALAAVKKANSQPASTMADARYAPAGLTVTGITFEQAFYRVAVNNQLAAPIACDLDFTNGPEGNRLCLAPNEGIAIRAYGAVVAGAYVMGQMTWAEKA
jgi:hypothetical protein